MPPRALDVLVLIDPPEDLKPAKDSSIAILRALAARGHTPWIATSDALRRADRVRVPATRVGLPASGSGPWFQALEARDLALADVAAVLMRKDPPVDGGYLTATHLLGAAAREGARVFNAPAALRDHNEKLAILEFPQFIAPTLVSADPDDIRAFQREHEQIVIKPLDGMGGAGIFRLGPGDPNAGVILETATAHGTRTVMAQRYLPAIAQGDKRVLLIDGAPVPQALARIPRPGESRGNLAAGGAGRAQPLSARDREIAEALGPVLAARGLFLVGLDVIGDHLTEINVTSPTCFVEIATQSGFDVAAHLVQALEQRLQDLPA
jgi:glutathione synthase